jgi:LemA protein
MKKVNKKGFSAVTTLLLIIVGIVVIGGLIVLVVVGLNNSLISASVKIDNAWSEIRVQYQRRYDLIPNVVEVTRDYMQFEQELLTNITRARTAWVDSLSSTIEDQMVAGNELNSVLGQWLVTVENYPELKSSEVVLTLIDELEGTENRIAVARGRYNDDVASYNTMVRTFPTSVVANMFGHTVRPYYYGDEGIEQVPTADLLP